MLNSITKHRLAFSFAVLLFAASVSPAQVDTAPYFAFVSVEGADTNACTRVAPCREVSRALDVVRTGGTVMIIRSGEYNGFTISKNVRVVAEKGSTASIIGSGEPAVIDIGNLDARLQVRLQGLKVYAKLLKTANL